MKINRIYIMMAIFSAAVLVSCERAQEKDELEAGFSSPGACLPWSSETEWRSTSSAGRLSWNSLFQGSTG